MLSEEGLDAEALRELAIHKLMVERAFFEWLPASAGFVYLGVSVVMCLIRPKLGFVLIVFSLFFRFQDRIPLYAQFPGFLTQLCALAVGIGLAHQQLDLRLAKVDKWLLGFAAISSVGLLLRHREQLIGEMAAYVSSLAIFFAGRWLMTNKEELQRVMLAMAVAISCLAFEAFYALYLQQGPHPFWLEFASGAPSRLQSIGYFANPNDFGFILNVGFALWLALFFYSKRWLLKAFYLLCMVLNVYVVTLTLSRSQLLTSAMIVAFAWVLLSKGKIVKKVLMMASVFALILAVLMQVPGPIKDRLDTMRGGPDASMQGRFHAWQEGLDMFRAYPIFGWGRQQWLQYHGLAAHNGYVQTLGETGSTGALLFLGFLAALIRPLFKFNQVCMRHDKTLYMGPILMMACLMWVWMLGNVTYTTITYFMFSLVAVLGGLIEQGATPASAEVATSTSQIPVKKFRSRWLDRARH